MAMLTTMVAAIGCINRSDDRPRAWSYVSAAITEPNCATARCHGQATAAAGLDFSSAQRGYTSLTGLWVWIVDPDGTADQGCRVVGATTVCQREHRSLVVPFDPSQSRLVAVLRGRDAPRMPPASSLPEVDIRLIEGWILDGATDDRASDANGQRVETQTIKPAIETGPDGVDAIDAVDTARCDGPAGDQGNGG